MANQTDHKSELQKEASILRFYMENLSKIARPGGWEKEPGDTYDLGALAHNMSRAIETMESAAEEMEVSAEHETEVVAGESMFSDTPACSNSTNDHKWESSYSGVRCIDCGATECF